MGIQSYYELDLNRPDVLMYTTNPSQAEWDEQLDLAPYVDRGFEDANANERIVSQEPAGGAIKTVAAVTFNYEIFERDPTTGTFHNVGRTSAQEIYVQESHLELRAKLLILAASSDGPSPSERTKILEAYDQFKPGRDDLYSYMSDRMKGTNITEDKFEILLTARLVQDGSPKIDRSQTKYVEDGPTGTIDSDSGGGKGRDLREEIRRLGYKVKLISKEHGQRVRGHVGDGFSIVGDEEHPYAHGIDDPDPAIDKVEQARLEVLPCKVTDDKLRKRIATLTNYPEFKLSATWEMRRIGCITTKIPILTLEIRISKLALYSFARSDDVGKLLKSILNDCLIAAAIGAVVVGLVTLNFAIALAAFKGAFASCIKIRAATAVPCYLVGLVIIKEIGVWKVVTV